MTFDDIYSAVEEAGNVTAFGAKLKFELGDNVILIDGTGDKNVVSKDNGEAAYHLNR